MLVPGQKIREYVRIDGRTDTRVREVDSIVDGEYKLRQLSQLEGVQRRSYERAKQCEIMHDGITYQERGMVDRVLYPRRKGASRKFVRNVRVSERREGAVVCDLVSENKRSSVLTMAAVMNTYKHSAERVTGRNRSHALPSKVAERLQTLKMTDSIRRAILGAIPPSRRAQLEKRRAANLRSQGGIGGLRAHQRDRSKASDDANGRPCPLQDTHTHAERGRANAAASFDGKSRQDGDRARKRGRKSSDRDDLLTERDSRRLRPRTGSTDDVNYTHDWFYARRRLGGDAEGRAEGGGGRGSQVPRRGFPK